MTYRVLVTSLLAGLGHVMAKKDLLETLKGKGDDIEFFEYDSEVTLYDSIYKLIVKFPKLYNQFYFNYKSVSNVPDNVIYKLEKKAIKNLIEKNNIDLVITTHPFHSMAFDKLRKQFGYKYQIANLITDYGDQPGYFMVGGNFDYCLVKDERTKHLNSKYFPEEKIFVLGTGIKHTFYDYSLKPKKSINEEFFKIQHFVFDKEINADKKSIVFLGGSGWARTCKRIINKLAKKGKYNILVSCGRDEDLFEELKYTKNVYPFGFVNHDVMALIEAFSDIAIFSSFGATVIYEIMNLNKYPLFVHKIIGPQESQNIKFMNKYKLGLYEPDQKKMLALIDDYLTYPYKYKKFVNNQKKFVENIKNISEQNYEMILKIILSGN